ncbi:alkylglycerol monooxygenase-like isoform X1 [Tachypleus tridentatus]|uniref:alkylglycerol monooxygenase-like isoform X1 n=1 Tax=Tachypleus tridentatus TaxID=6853 RepID=UPI003FD3B24C
MFNVYIISIFYLPLALGILPAVFLVHYELNLLYQVWIHSRLFDKLELLEYMLNTPSHHRVHHGSWPTSKIRSSSTYVAHSVPQHSLLYAVDFLW